MTVLRIALAAPFRIGLLRSILHRRKKGHCMIWPTVALRIVTMSRNNHSVLSTQFRIILVAMMSKLKVGGPVHSSY